MDASAYIDSDKWERMKNANGWNEIEMRDNRYNQIVHMVSAANGAEEFYSTEVGSTFIFCIIFQAYLLFPLKIALYRIIHVVQKASIWHVNWTINQQLLGSVIHILMLLIIQQILKQKLIV